MPPILEEKQGLHEVPPESLKTAEMPKLEVPEYDEAGLEQLVNTAHSEVEASAGQTIVKADKKIEAGASSIDLDKQKAQDIMSSGGFSEWFNKIKEKITALAQSTKEKINNLISDKPDVANLHIVTNEPEPQSVKKIESSAAIEAPTLEPSPQINELSEPSTESLETNKEINLSFNREDVEQVFASSDYKAEKLIELFRADFSSDLAGDVGVTEKYTLEQHLRMTMGQFEKYFSDKELPAGVDKNFFRMYQMLHDIGKTRAVADGRKIDEHAYTLKVMRPVLEKLGYDDSQIKIAEALVDGDPLGEFVKSNLVGENFTAEKILAMSERAGMEAGEFWKLLDMFYKVDAGSYTADAGGADTLGNKFKFKPEERSMDYSSYIKVAMEGLRAVVLAKAEKNKESAELKQYLENEVLPALHLTKEAEALALAETSGNEREILQRSFNNVRDTITALYKLDTVEGRADMKSIKGEYQRRSGELLYSKLTDFLATLSEKTAIYGITLTADSLGMTSDSLDIRSLSNKLLEISDELQKKIAGQVEAKINAILEAGQSYNGLEMPTPDKYGDRAFMTAFSDGHTKAITEEATKLFDETGFEVTSLRAVRRLEELNAEISGPHPDEFKKRLTKEQITQQLLQETARVQSTGFVNVNISAAALEKVLSHGGFRDALGMSKDELASLGKTERAYGDYIENRKTTEQALGIYNPEGVIVYGTQASDSDGELQRGGASVYGDIFLKFKPQVKVVYTESDSMWMSTSEVVSKKLQDNGIGDGYAESAVARQVAPEHAAIAKAILNLDHHRHAELQDEPAHSTYLEAQILNPGLQDIESINIPRSVMGKVADERYGGNFVKLLERLQHDPLWKDKINFTEA